MTLALVVFFACLVTFWLLRRVRGRHCNASVPTKQESRKRHSRWVEKSRQTKASRNDDNKPAKVVQNFVAEQNGKEKRWRKRKSGVTYEYTELQSVPRQDEELLCSRCVCVKAKPLCSYRQCGRCCRGNPQSVCMAHGMGALVAAEMVERAITFQLLELDLSYQHLKTCPAQLPELGSILVTLNLSNNRLTGLPDDLSNLCCVEELFLQYNCLMKLPESVGCMTRLYELDVKNNRLVALPASIGNLTCLAILNTTNNVLTSVPPSLGRVIKLQELCLHSNRLKDLPENVCKLKDLESLFLGENRLECLPFKIGHFRQMTEMDVSGCELRQLPNSICDCVSLKKLWVCSNRLMGLPAQMGRLVNLKELHVRRNQIRAFPASLARLHVYTFTAYNNPLLDEYNKLGLQRLTKEPKDDLPPLLELSARAVYNHGIEHNTGCIPQELEALLSSVRICSSCGGPFFFHFRSNVFFHTVGVFHRVPLLQQLCSPLGNKKCVPLESKR